VETLAVRLCSDRPITMPADAADVLRAAGVRWSQSANELSVVFPRA
jgi:hypothetical protein